MLLRRRDRARRVLTEEIMQQKRGQRKGRGAIRDERERWKSDADGWKNEVLIEKKERCLGDDKDDKKIIKKFGAFFVPLLD